MPDGARQWWIRRNARQAALSARWLACRREEILGLAHRARDAADRHLARTRRHYPRECCEEIRDTVWQHLERTPDIARLRGLGLDWRRVFFIDEGSECQNAIQLGDWLLDVAGDACGDGDEAVTFRPLNEVAYENLDTWPRYLEVMERKCDARAVPNREFPLLFPLAPVYLVRETRPPELLVHQDLVFRLDFEDGWTRARSLLEDDRFMSRSLPESARRMIERTAGTNEAAACPAEYRPSGPEEIAGVLEEWEPLRRQPPERVEPVIARLLDLARGTAAALRRAALTKSATA